MTKKDRIHSDPFGFYNPGDTKWKNSIIITQK